MADCFELKIQKECIDDLERDFDPKGLAYEILRNLGYKGQTVEDLKREYNNRKCKDVLLTAKNKSEFHSEQAGISVKRNSGLATKSEYSEIDRMSLRHHSKFSNKHIYGFDKEHKLVQIGTDSDGKAPDFIYSGQSQKVTQKKSTRNEHFIKCCKDKRSVYMVVQDKNEGFTIIMGFYRITHYDIKPPPADANPKDKYYPYTFYMERLT